MPERTGTVRENGSLRIAAGFLLFCFLVLSPAVADEYMDPASFLDEVFEQDVPAASMAWLTGDKGEHAREILGHDPESLRVRYWRRDARSAWILDEIGREKPITAGFVIENGRLVRVQVLVFRESRGWEIRHEFFTRQFDGAQLGDDRRLDRSIDNITGATMSVSAMKRMARLALYLEASTRKD